MYLESPKKKGLKFKFGFDFIPKLELRFIAPRPLATFNAKSNSSRGAMQHESHKKKGLKHKLGSIASPYQATIGIKSSLVGGKHCSMNHNKIKRRTQT